MAILKKTECAMHLYLKQIGDFERHINESRTITLLLAQEVLRVSPNECNNLLKIYFLEVRIGMVYILNGKEVLVRHTIRHHCLSKR